MNSPTPTPTVADSWEESVQMSGISSFPEADDVVAEAEFAFLADRSPDVEALDLAPIEEVRKRFARGQTPAWLGRAEVDGERVNLGWIVHPTAILDREFRGWWELALDLNPTALTGDHGTVVTLFDVEARPLYTFATETLVGTVPSLKGHAAGGRSRSSRRDLFVRTGFVHLAPVEDARMVRDLWAYDMGSAWNLLDPEDVERAYRHVREYDLPDTSPLVTGTTRRFLVEHRGTLGLERPASVSRFRDYRQKNLSTAVEETYRRAEAIEAEVERTFRKAEALAAHLETVRAHAAALESELRAAAQTA